MLVMSLNKTSVWKPLCLLKVSAANLRTAQSKLNFGYRRRDKQLKVLSFVVIIFAISP